MITRIRTALAPWFSGFCTPLADAFILAAWLVLGVILGWFWWAVFG